MLRYYRKFRLISDTDNPERTIVQQALVYTLYNNNNNIFLPYSRVTYYEQNPHFFLVDDDIDDASLFQELLSKVNPSIKFAHANDGKEAMDQLLTKSTEPDLIFLDLNMPKMDGKQFLKLIKQEDELKDIPVIMYTTSSQSQDIEETMLHGAVCFITKPSSIRELESILSSIAESMPEELDDALRYLSNNANTFIVC